MELAAGRVAPKLLLMLLYLSLFWSLKACESVFSTRPFKQRPTNSSLPLCFGRKTRRSQSVKFESVVLGARKSGGSQQLWGRRGGEAHYYVDKLVCSCLFNLILFFRSLCTARGCVCVFGCWTGARGEEEEGGKVGHLAAFRHPAHKEGGKKSCCVCWWDF